jgi:hypothetical protein
LYKLQVVEASEEELNEYNEHYSSVVEPPTAAQAAQRRARNVFTVVQRRVGRAAKRFVNASKLRRKCELLY